MAIKSRRDVLPVHPAADLFPMMSKEELLELADDIKKHGLKHKIDLYFDANTNTEYVPDGRNRLDALEMLGREVLDDKGKLQSKYHRQTPTNLGSAPDLVAWVISTNIRRRHLNTAQKRDLHAKLTKANPDISSRRVAKIVGVSPTTATKSRRKLEATGDVSNVDTSTDTKGRQQPVRWHSLAPKPTSRFIGPEGDLLAGLQGPVP